MLFCPQCQLFLEPAAAEDKRLFACRGCGGAWFDSEEAARAFAESDSSVSAFRIAYPAPPSSGMFEGLLRYCPLCRTVVLEPGGPAPGDSDPLRCSRCGGIWLAPAPAPTPAAAAPESLITDPAQTPAASSMSAAEMPAPVPNPIHGSLRTPVTDADSAIARLLEGNRRFVAGRPWLVAMEPERRVQAAENPMPFAVILTCSDSRVPPEMIFDQGIGDLFVVRNAGHVTTEVAMDSIEFAVGVFKSVLVLVMAHSRCGAVNAAVAAYRAGADSAAESSIVSAILPAVQLAREIPGSLEANAALVNARLVTERLNRFLDEWVKAGKVRVQTAHYDVESGRVELI